MVGHDSKQPGTRHVHDLDPATAPAAGKRTQVELSYGDGGAAPVQRARPSAASPAIPEGVRPTMETLFGGRLVQRRVQSTADAIEHPDAVHKAAALGTSGAGGPLPHLDAIQRSFGSHDMTAIRAHTDPAAATGAADMGASAFATGHHVAFAGTPDLHTTAHEAAHVIQQRAGVHLKGGVGEQDDAYERHADEVADRVVAGQAAQSLLDSGPATGGARSSSTSGAIQRALVRKNGRYWSTLDPSTTFDNKDDARAYDQRLQGQSSTAPGPGSSSGQHGPSPSGGSAPAPLPMVVPSTPSRPGSGPSLLSPSPTRSPAAYDYSPIRPGLRAFIGQRAPVPSDDSQPLAVGEVEPYRKTTAKSRGRKGDQITGDHIPSNASNQKRLTGSKTKIRDDGLTLAVTDQDHKKHSRTYGGRNSKSQIESDAANPQSAVYKDLHTYQHAMKAEGTLNAPFVASLGNLYATQTSAIPPTHQTNDMMDHYMRAVALPPAASTSTASPSASLPPPGPGTSSPGALPPSAMPTTTTLVPPQAIHPAGGTPPPPTSTTTADADEDTEEESTD